MTDMERLIDAADALFEVMDMPDQSDGKEGRYHYDWYRVDYTLAAYRAAREAITRGTPPAFATSA
jgi:hypothetical protein